MTDRQRAAADPAVSAWVMASAGTGKTHVLTSRVLRLLLAGTPPERILCLTFTKAAAAEMANRIQRTLAQWVTAEDAALVAALERLGTDPEADVMPRARRLFAEVLEVPGGLKIQTIHAFCQSLLARFPLEAGLPPHFRLIDERSSAEALRTAVDGILMTAGASEALLAPALDHMARRLTEHSFSELVGAVIGERGLLERLSRAFQTLTGVMLATRRHLGLDGAETVAELIAAAVADDAFDQAGLKLAATALLGGSAAEAARGQIVATWLADPEGRAAGLAAYQGVFLTNDGSIRKSLANKPTHARHPGLQKILETEAERLQALIERRALLEVADNTAALLTFGFAVLDAYAREKRRQAVLDYDDLILATLGLLERAGVAPWVLFKLDGGLDHILVDEAQDTNPEQWRVIQALADEFFSGASARNEGRTIFAVGDVKQSIYSFQRADPREFLRARNHFRARVEQVDGRFLDVPLDFSFRSTPAVLGFVDAVFAPDELKAGLLDDVYNRHHTKRLGEAGQIELWPPVLPDAEPDDIAEGWALPLALTERSTPQARLAIRIARQIRGWLDGGERLASQNRPIRPGDVLLLVRRRGGLVQLLISALKLLDVPVAGADRMVVTDQIAVMDLMALARFALLPEDDLTLATVLKSPLIGFDEDALFALAHGRGDETLWQVLAKRRDETPLFARAHAALAAVLRAADFRAPYDFFARVLNERDNGPSGRERIVARLGHEAHDPLDEFLSLALAYEAAQPPSLQGFLHWLEAREVEIKRDMEQGRDEVRIMTVHGAKGLQAPIVILPDTCQLPDSRERLVGIATPEATVDRLLVWPGKVENAVGVVGAARDAMKARGREEYLRLLYVALTRAEDRLYIAGYETTRRRGEGCWYDLISAAFTRLEGVVTVETSEGPVQRLVTAQEAAPKTAATTASAPPPVALPEWARRPAPGEPTPPRPLAPSRPVEDEPAVDSPLLAAAARSASAVRFRRGTLIHRLLERLPALAPAERAAAARRFLAAPAYGLSAGEIAALAGEVLAVLDDPTFAPLFAPGSAAEVPIAGLVGATPVAGQIDRLAVTEDAVLIVDYKTNRPPPQHPEDVAPAYLRQMAAYRQLLMAVYPGRTIHCALLWTDGPRLMALDPERLDVIQF